MSGTEDNPGNAEDQISGGTGFLDDFEMPDGTGFLDDLKKEKSNGLDFGEGSGFLDDLEDDTVDYRPTVYFKSSEDMSEVDSESVHLVVTSPPYNTDWEYGSHDDSMDYANEYMPMLASVFGECYRVLVPGGRLVINIPSLLRDGASGGYPIAAHIQTMMEKAEVSPFNMSFDDEQMPIGNLRTNTDWRLREFIVWNKGFNTDGLAPNGSFPRPWGILLNNMHEVALVFQKPGDRDFDNMDDKVIEDSKIDKWSDELCDDVWSISPDNHKFKYVSGENVPPFPEEFVKRCIALWTYKDDTVLDPFLGRGTTCKVAKQMDRDSIGYELREELKRDIEEYTNADQADLDNW